MRCSIRAIIVKIFGTVFEPVVRQQTGLLAGNNREKEPNEFTSS
jgi:hypothetical protein